ncbi:MAG: cytochrome C assembly protein [Limnohabitans sp.]|nr:cytochrome C assembly protein [Limnohabitans sp.]
MILASDIPLNLWLGLPTAAAYALTALIGPRVAPAMGHRLLAVPWALHGLGLVFALFAPQDGAVRFGFAPALSVTAWLMLTFYVLEQHWFPQLKTRWTSASAGAAAVMLASLFPGSALHMQASPWLPLHLALGVASYGLIAAAVVHAWLMMRAEKSMRQGADAHVGLPLLTLERLTFRFVSAGFVLLTATLAAGWLFGDSLYGAQAAWRWDHKTVFSLLAWCTFAVLLVGRSRFGWRGRKAVRVLYAGTLLLLLGYAGSRFVLEVVLGRVA